jgi:enamine deaminase RidA (YjgF/YER057c/UK114 family)
MPPDFTPLPKPSAAGGSYLPVVIHQGLAFVSGQLPRLDGVVQYCGKVGHSVSLEQAQKAARLCASQCLAALDQELGGLSRVIRILRVTGYVASAPGFDQQPAVMDAASEYFCEVLGTRGQHARSAIGVAELPRGACVEVEITVAVKD